MAFGSSTRVGDWMRTASGRRYWPLDPRPEDVCLHDIAEHLAKECRYNGGCRGFYSVAEHSVLVSMVVPQEHALQALFHDAPEAYLKDITRPAKAGLGPAYHRLEQMNWEAIAEHFGIDPFIHSSVKAADDAVLLAERAVLFPADHHKWDVAGEPAAVPIWGMEWQGARDAFLRRYRELVPS